MQNISPRELSPSPSFRERNRAIKAHSMPVVPTTGLAQQPSPTTSNSSHQSRRSPPPTTRISPATTKMASTLHPRDRSPEHPNTPPPLIHNHSQPAVSHIQQPIAPPLPHMQSQPSVMSHMSQAQHQPRPIPRVPPPPFLNQYQSDDKWHVTEELIAEIERADFQQAQGQFSHPAGTSGVAYAGGIASSGGSLHLQHSVAVTAKDPAVERVKANDRVSPKDDSNAQASKRLSRDKDRDLPVSRESPKTRERAQTVSSVSSYTDAHTSVNRTPEYRGSPQYTTPLGSPGERSASYAQYVPDSYRPVDPQIPPRPASRKGVSAQNATIPDANPPRQTPPATTKLASHTPPLQAMATRPPDRSLPVQEEPEEDVGNEFLHGPEFHELQKGSPTPSSDLYPEGHSPRYDSRRDQVPSAAREDRDDDTLDEETLNEEIDEHLAGGKASTESEAFTPRSPSVTLPERPRDAAFNGSGGVYSPTSNGVYTQASGDHQKTIRAKHRNGSTDQLGLRTFDPAMFETTVNSLRSNGPDVAVNVQRPYQQPQDHRLSREEVEAENLRQQYVAAHIASHVADQRMQYARAPSQRSDDLQSLLDDPTSSYLRAYLQSPGTRPDAPIPPTPHSQTAAPSPSPLVSAMPSDIEPRQVGSPYPYPFTHIRRSTVNGPLQAPSSSFDAANPAIVREQLALQMQIYALNNGLAASDSTFSPSSTPFPGPGYNPWTFVPIMGNRADIVASSMSMRSSPSHEPVQLPPPPMFGRVRRRDNNPTQRMQQGGARTLRRVKPPPRVESTQPRETSPEPSSGEETAGEDHFAEQYAAARAASASWNNGGGDEPNDNSTNGNGDSTLNSPRTDDSGEWVDVDEEDEEEDLLQLEFHPTYVSNPQKRRRRFNKCWDALTEAVSHRNIKYNDDRPDRNLISSSKSWIARPIQH